MASDIAWYAERTSGPIQEFYDLFFAMCRKYNVSWGKASEKEKAFIEEVTRVTFELEMAEKNGTPISEVKLSFCN